MPGRIEAATNNSGLPEADGRGIKMSAVNGTYGDDLHGQINSMVGALSNGMSDAPPSALPERSVDAPEIEHIIANFMPLSRLFQRTAQECFNSLNETVSALSALPATQQIRAAGVNGAGTANGAVANSEKKLKWLHFANTNREKFIKLLVLLQWSRRVDEVSALIDLVVWSNMQIQSYDAASHFMGEIKRGLESAKVPSPDIVTALEALTLGRSERMPDLGYIPPAPLSAQKLLSTLQNINVLLHLRLNLHEDLPRHFRTFSIASGRATFTVASEFEVDLSIADEDPASQLYFIDFRFLFASFSEIPAGPLRNELEGRANEVLATEGLAGCFQFLHDFVLTHKLNIMRRQAMELNRSMWSGSLRVEQVHRVLIVQYWVDRAGSKSWFEIGVASGKQESFAEGREEMSHLAVRWFMEGQEMKGEGLGLSANIVSLEQTLKRVICHHVTHRLSPIHAALTSHARLHSNLPLPLLSTSETEPGHIRITLATMPADPPSRVDLSRRRIAGDWQIFFMETTGHVYIEPINEFTEACREALQNFDKESYLPTVSYWMAREVQQTVARAARSYGLGVWESSELQPNMMLEYFGGNVDCGVFLSDNRWIDNWFVAGILKGPEVSWWVGQFDKNNERHRIENLNVIPVEFRTHTNKQRLGSSMFFLTLEFAATKTITYITSLGELDRLDVYTNVIRNHEANQLARRVESNPSMIQIRLTDLLETSDLDRSFREDNIDVHHMGYIRDVDRIDQHVTQAAVVRVKMTPKLKMIIGSGNEPHIETEAKLLKFQFFTSLGSVDWVGDLRLRLETVLRTRDYYDVMRKIFRRMTYEMTCGSLVINYGDGPDGEPISAKLVYAGNHLATLSLHPPSNPHKHLLHQFKGIVRLSLGGHAAMLHRLITELLDTLPIVRAIDECEGKPGRPAGFSSATVFHQGSYQIRYERPCLTFDITAENTLSGPDARWRFYMRRWSIGVVQLIAEMKTHDLAEDLDDDRLALAENGFTCDTNWAMSLIERIDEKMLVFEEEEGEDFEVHFVDMGPYTVLPVPTVPIEEAKPFEEVEIVVLDE